MLVVNPSFAARSVGELIEMAKADPGAINYGSGGVGTTPHTAAELFFFNSGIRMTHVAYRGEAPAIADVIAGPAAALFANLSVTGQVKARVARAGGDIAQARAEPARRADARRSWASRVHRRDLVRPHRPGCNAARDRATAERRSAGKALAAPDLQQRYAGSAFGDAELPEELDGLLKSEAVRWGEVIRRANIRAPE